MLAWIKMFFTLLIGTSTTIQSLIAEGFDEIREHFTSKTTTKIDDGFLAFIEAIILQQYVTGGTGQMEAFLAYILPKVSPWVRFELYGLLVKLQAKCQANSIPGDEDVVGFLITAIYPNGAPEDPGLAEQTAAAPDHEESK